MWLMISCGNVRVVKPYSCERPSGPTASLSTCPKQRHLPSSCPGSECCAASLCDRADHSGNLRGCPGMRKRKRVVTLFSRTYPNLILLRLTKFGEIPRLSFVEEGLIRDEDAHLGGFGDMLRHTRGFLHEGSSRPPAVLHAGLFFKPGASYGTPSA